MSLVDQYTSRIQPVSQHPVHGADFHELAATEGIGGQATIYGLAAGQDTLARSVDGGVTWSAGAELQARDLEIAGGPSMQPPRTVCKPAPTKGTTFTPDSDAPALYL